MKTSIEKYKVGREGANFYDVVVRDNRGRYKKRVVTTSMKSARAIAKKFK
jgi:hypothetical protein